MLINTNTIDKFQRQNCRLKIGETLTKTSKLSTVSRRRLKFEVVFPGKVLNQRIHFAALMSKLSSIFVGAIMKCQRCSESETLHKIEVLPYAMDRMVGSKT